MADENLYKKNNNRFKTILLSYSRHPEKVFLVFFIISILALVVGVWYSRNTIRKPFLITSETQQQEDNSEALDNFSTLLAEQQKDTDEDGLTDYQEINIYKTSIYLKDSDSDGIDDNVEIAQGLNPTCPEGQDCSFVDTPDSKITADDLVPNDDLFISPEYIASAKLILLQNGYTEEELDSMTDDVVIETYQSVLDDADSNLNKEQQLVAGNIEIDDLRRLLLENGVEADVLDQISDEDLLDAYTQVLTQEQ